VFCGGAARSGRGSDPGQGVEASQPDSGARAGQSSAGQHAHTVGAGGLGQAPGPDGVVRVQHGLLLPDASSAVGRGSAVDAGSDLADAGRVVRMGDVLGKDARGTGDCTPVRAQSGDMDSVERRVLTGGGAGLDVLWFALCLSQSSRSATADSRDPSSHL
jgi:hypothetical protein